MIVAKMVICASVLMLGTTEAAEEKPDVQAEQALTPQAAQQQLAMADDDAAQPVPPELEIKKIDGIELAAIEANIVAYTNENRARYGLPPLTVDKELMESAREHAAWMTRYRSMVHTSRPVAENIAMGQRHSSDAVRAWMNSSGHRANILNSNHRRIGVGAFRTESGTIFWCQQFRR